MPAPIMPTVLRRLPQNYRSSSPPLVSEEMSGAPSIRRTSGEWVGQEELPIDLESQLYQRHEGGLLSRALGTAVHALLEQLATLRKVNEWEPARAALKRFEPRIAALIRSTGVDQSGAAGIAAEALRLALSASDEPMGRWILSPHAEDASEARWTGVVAGGLRTVQVDRLFRAGLNPLSEGDQAWWIIDYKTAHAENLAPSAALPELRALFAPQLATYAEVLRKMHGNDTPIRAGLYYPRMLLFDFWEI